MPEIVPNWKRREGWKAWAFRILVLMLLPVIGSGAGREEPELLASPGGSVWEAGVGAGFVKGAKEFGLSAGAGVGMEVLGSEHTHDWALASAEYGWMLSGVVGRDSCWRGNWELLAELFGGGQFQPDAAYIAGGALHLRYNFGLGHRLVPFLDVGAGGGATSIRNGDLSTEFEFNLQGVIGTHIFLRDDLALTLQYRFIHLSNANLDLPNLGVNTSNFMAGITWFF